MGSITLSTITTTRFVSVRDVTVCKNLTRIVESRRAFCAESNLLPVQPRSKLPACGSFVYACARRG